MTVIQFRPSGGWVGGRLDTSRKIMPLRGPTCKIARFQAELKFPSWTECGNTSGFPIHFSARGGNGPPPLGGGLKGGESVR